MAEKDRQSGSQNQYTERNFSQEQYHLLKQCSEKKDMSEWNEWRVEHVDEKILLEGANLAKADLIGAHLLGANLKGAHLMRANLEVATLIGANLEDAYLWEANLKGAYLAGANLESAFLAEANLENAYLQRANLKGADLGEANLKGANFLFTVVDGSTRIIPRKFDRFTNFTGVGLNNTCVDPGTKQLLEYNIRRWRWKQWYDKHAKLKWLVSPFWLMCDYGMSTGRIAFVFFGLALVFANIYYHWARMAPPGIVENLFVDRNGVDVQWWLVPLRTLYFSIVTQTTLGFGDMYARAQSICGHILLSLQVILGYVLLGALVTRFAVLFTAGGPAGEFTEKEQKIEQRQ